jgi:hypothetical protein
MSFLGFAVTAVLCSALVSALLLAIISLLSPRVHRTGVNLDVMKTDAGYKAADRPREIAVKSHSTRLS